MQHEFLGIDVGATGMKGAIVNTLTGQLITDRFRLKTPKPATPKAMADTFKSIVKHFNYRGPVGCGFPAVIKKNQALTATNIDKNWIGKNVADTFGATGQQPIFVLNDADAAAIAELEFGEGTQRKGLVMLITIGTGLGTCLFLDGEMIPNTELGHIAMHGKIAERYCANSVRKDFDLSWEEWGKRFNEYLQLIYHYLSPDSIILSGGVSKKFDKYEQYLDLPIDILPAQLRNNAGIVGAAAFAKNQVKKG